jgi:hypothetical protein
MSSHSQRQPWIVTGSLGGRRPRAGREERDMVRVQCSILRPLYEELCAREQATGIYRTQIFSALVSEELASGILDRELRAPRFGTAPQALRDFLSNR